MIWTVSDDDWADVDAVHDTALHRAIELADFETAGGELVIYHPDRSPDEFVVSDTHTDTYNYR